MCAAVPMDDRPPGLHTPAHRAGHGGQHQLPRARHAGTPSPPCVPCCPALPCLARLPGASSHGPASSPPCAGPRRDQGAQRRGSGARLHPGRPASGAGAGGQGAQVGAPAPVLLDRLRANTTRLGRRVGGDTAPHTADCLPPCSSASLPLCLPSTGAWTTISSSACPWQTPRSPRPSTPGGTPSWRSQAPPLQVRVSCAAGRRSHACWCH